MKNLLGMFKCVVGYIILMNFIYTYLNYITLKHNHKHVFPLLSRFNNINVIWFFIYCILKLRSIGLIKIGSD